MSVIIPTYQRCRLLMDRAIPSVLAQTVQDQEVLVVGDGTDAQTEAEMFGLCSVNANVHFWNLPHYPYPEDHDAAWGLYGLAALNFGLDRARGEWISVLGDDDEYLPDHHAVLLDAAARTAAEHVYGLAETFKGGHPIGQQYGSWPPGDGAIANGANLYLASLGFRYDLRCGERARTGDADLWTRMFESGVRFHFTPTVVLRYHRNWP